MHTDLVTLGFTSPYNRVAAFARDWRADRQREQHTTGRGTFPSWRSAPAKRSSSIGARISRLSAGSARSVRSPISRCHSAGPSFLRAYPLQTHDLSHRARMGGAAMAWMFDAHCATAAPRSGTSPTSSILNSRLNFRLVISTLQLLGHDLIFVSTKPAAAQSAPSEVGLTLHHGKGTPGEQIRDDSVRFKAKSAAAATKGRKASHALTPA